MDHYGPFIVALPDVDSGSLVQERLQGLTDARLDHPSGRPWLLARVGPQNLRAHAEGERRVAVVGQTSASPDDLERIARKVRTPRELADFSRRFDGSFCVFGSFEGLLYASGPAMQTRRIFHAEFGGVRVLADRADILADLCGLEVDYTALGLRLAGGLPHPADDLPMWKDLVAVPGEDYVVVRRDGVAVNSETWWSRPKPTLSRAEGAERLREAIAAAVRVRTAAGTDVACDLSGGLDSTPLCYFAAQGPRGVLARTFYTEDPGGREDLYWAQRALPSMPGVHTHEVFSTDRLPDFFGGLSEMRIHLDEPTQAAAAAPRIQHMLDDDVELGIRTHINGVGGDHLFRGVKAWDHKLMPTRPIVAWRRARAENAATGVGVFTTLRQLLDRRSYRQWFLETVNDAVNDVEPPELPRINDWSVPLRFPSWLSDEGRHSLAERLWQLGTDVEPLGDDLAGHFDIFTLREAGKIARSTGLVGQMAGVSYDAPLLDDHVVEAALEVRYEDRDSPIEWKPLMKAAMRGLIPDDYLRRTTKIGGGPQSVRGYAAHFESLVGLWEESGLLESGLIDRGLLHSTAQPSATAAPTSDVRTLTDAAIFLRDLRHATRQPSFESK